MTSPLIFPCRTQNDNLNQGCLNTVFWYDETQSWSSETSNCGVNVSQLINIFWDRVDRAFRHNNGAFIECNNVRLYTEDDVRKRIKTSCENCRILVAQLLSPIKNSNNTVLIEAFTFEEVQIAIGRDLKEKEQTLEIFEAEEAYFNTPNNLDPKQETKQTFLGKILLTARNYYHPNAPSPEQANATNLEVYFDSWNGNDPDKRYHKAMLKKSKRHQDEKFGFYSNENLGGCLVNIMSNCDFVEIDLIESSGDFGHIQCRKKIEQYLVPFLNKKFNLLGFKEIKINLKNSLNHSNTTNKEN